MKVRDKNPTLKELIEDLQKKGTEQPLWKKVAQALNRPQRNKHQVNLRKLQKRADSEETIVVPGAVLGSGHLDKSLTVAAWKFSGRAEESIEKAGGKTMTIRELFEKNPDPSKIRIMG